MPQTNGVVDQFSTRFSFRCWAILREFLPSGDLASFLLVVLYLLIDVSITRETILVSLFKFRSYRCTWRNLRKLEEKMMDDREAFYALPFGDLPRDGEADGDGSGLHPLLLPRRLPVPLAFSRTMVSKWRNLKLSLLVNRTIWYKGNYLDMKLCLWTFRNFQTRLDINVTTVILLLSVLLDIIVDIHIHETAK